MDMPNLSRIRVRLTLDEEVTAHRVGFERATAIRGTANHSSRYDRGLNYHEYIAQLSESVGSEMAVAKYFQITDFAPTVNTFKTQADVGSRLEIKHTKWMDGHLVVHHSDRIDDIAVLVVGRSPEYWLAGWIPVADAKHKRFFVESEKNWWISQRDLRPMTDFLRSKYARASL